MEQAHIVIVVSNGVGGGFAALTAHTVDPLETTVVKPSVPLPPTDPGVNLRASVKLITTYYILFLYIFQLPHRHFITR